MTASEQAKAAGLKSLALVSQMTGVSTQTLNNWHHDKPQLFAVVLAGCRSSLDAELRTLDRYHREVVSRPQYELLSELAAGPVGFIGLSSSQSNTANTLHRKGMVEPAEGRWHITVKGREALDKYPEGEVPEE